MVAIQHHELHHTNRIVVAFRWRDRAHFCARYGITIYLFLHYINTQINLDKWYFFKHIFFLYINLYIKSLCCLQSIDEELKSKDVEWDLLKMYVTKWEGRYKYNSGSTADVLSYHFILRRHWGIIYITYILPTIGTHRINTFHSSILFI